MIDKNTIRELLQGDLEHELENLHNNPVPPYNEASYWNQRYIKNPDQFDWFQPWSSFKGIALPLIDGRENVINVGCGNSPMTADLVRDGFKHVVGLDISSTVIEQNKKNFSNEKNIEWVVGNVLDLSRFEADSFDAVIDKGTFDSLRASGISNLKTTQFLSGICRILKPGGVFVEISYGSPKTREEFINPANFHVSGWTNVCKQSVEKMSERGYYHYIYCLQKDKDDD